MCRAMRIDSKEAEGSPRKSFMHLHRYLTEMELSDRDVCAGRVPIPGCGHVVETQTSYTQLHVQQALMMMVE